MDQDHKMNPNEWRMFNTDKKMFDFISNNRFYCTCGHSVIISPKETRILCRHCGEWIYRDKKEMFKSRLKGKMKNAN